MNIIRKILIKSKLMLVSLYKLPDKIENIQQSLGRIELRQLNELQSDDINAHEFKVFSQWGEDGIIQFLISRVPIENKVYVEFGIGDYSESNTRFLIQHNNWSGLVIDGSPRNIQALKQDNVSCRHNLKSECAFILKSNINKLISQNGITGDIGILSVDIDGNDYWIWEAIDCIQPRIVICEYNSLFGSEKRVTVVYQDDFQVYKAHYSGLYWGASIGAFEYLAKEKGYSLVGSNTAGNNIFFVRNDVVSDIPVYNSQQAHVKSQFRISRDLNGNLSFLDRDAGLDVIKDMPLYEVDTGKTITVEELSRSVQSS
jgi:hypothetical protein